MRSGLDWSKKSGKKLSSARFRLLENRRDLYYRAHLWNVRMSRMGPALKDMVRALENGATPPRRNSGRRGGDWTPQPLHPNTIAEIISTAIETCAIAKSDGHTHHNPPRAPFIAGKTAPHEREPKARYLSFEEIGKLIDACRRPHLLDLLLLDLGCGSRIGAVADVCGEYVHLDLGVIDLLGVGNIDSNKRRPIVPITGPMRGILERLIARHGDGYLIVDRGKPLALGARNWTQTIQRLVGRSKIDEHLKPGDTPANWYSIRRTLADWLDTRVSDASISAVLGHFEIAANTRRQLFEKGSPVTDIYKRRKLADVFEVANVLEREWWPSIQPYTSVDLGVSGNELMWTDA